MKPLIRCQSPHGAPYKSRRLKSIKKASVGYLPGITDLPTSFNVIQCIMDKTIECMHG